MRWYRNGIVALSVLMLVIGAALLGRGALNGQSTSLVIGALFAAVGAGRLYLLRRR